MSSLTIKIIIKPMLRLQTSTNTLLFEKEIERKITVRTDVLLKDICIDIMETVGLKHLSTTAKVLIKISDYKYHTFESFVPNLDLSIASLKPIFGTSLIFKILVPGKIEEFNESELKRTFCCNFLRLLLKRYSSIKNCVTDAVFKNLIESVENNSIDKLSYETLHEMNETIVNELKFYNNSNTPTTQLPNFDFKLSQPSLPLFLDTYINQKVETPNTPSSIGSIINSTIVSSHEDSTSLPFPFSSSSINNKSVPNCNETLLSIFRKTPPSCEGSNIMESDLSSSKVGAHNPRSRICFDQNIETPILELWFDITRTPTTSQLQDYADHLNTLSNRSDEDKITSHNVKIWFKNRRAKENRVNKCFVVKNI